MACKEPVGGRHLNRSSQVAQVAVQVALMPEQGAHSAGEWINH